MSDVTVGTKYLINEGAHAGKSCRVFLLYPDRGSHGFAEVQILDKFGVTTKLRDLVPCQYLLPAP